MSSFQRRQHPTIIFFCKGEDENTVVSHMPGVSVGGQPSMPLNMARRALLKTRCLRHSAPLPFYSWVRANDFRRQRCHLWVDIIDRYWPRTAERTRTNERMIDK